MLTTNERRPAIRTMRGWAIDVLKEAGAIRECEEHGWMHDRADPHARERAFDIARVDPPAGVSPDAAAAEALRYPSSVALSFAGGVKIRPGSEVGEISPAIAPCVAN
jgi:hypothetical protein